jgi:transposase InsO family protein
MCERVRHEGWTVSEAAEAFGVSTRTVFRWLRRFDAGAPMTDGSSVPHDVPGRTPAETEALIGQLRRLRWTSTRIAAELRIATSTVCAVVNRLGLNRLSRLEPPEPPNRYCRRHPGELIHVDIKKLGMFNKPGHRARGRGPGRRTQGIGSEYCHVAIDDTSRLAYVEILDDEKGPTCVGFVRRAIAWFAAHGVIVQAVMTDNGTGYRSKCMPPPSPSSTSSTSGPAPTGPAPTAKPNDPSRPFKSSGHTPPSTQDHRALLPWLEYYNYRRPHSALGHNTPASRITTD